MGKMLDSEAIRNLPSITCHDFNWEWDRELIAEYVGNEVGGDSISDILQFRFSIHCILKEV